MRRAKRKEWGETNINRERIEMLKRTVKRGEELQIPRVNAQ